MTFRLHHMHSIDVAYCYTRFGMVCLCVCVCVGLSVCLYVTGMNPAKTAEPIEMPFGMWAWVSPHSITMYQMVV